MIQIAYVSSTRELLSAEDIAQILSKSRENNGRRGITGMLLYKGGDVLQVLEGKRRRWRSCSRRFHRMSGITG